MLAGVGRFLVERVVGLLPPLAPRAANQYAHHNPSFSTFLRAFNPRCTPTALCLVLHHLRAHPVLHLTHVRSRVSERAEATRRFFIFWLPLKSLKRAVVGFYAEHAHQASDRYCFLPTASTPEITLRVLRGAHTVLVPVQLSGSSADQVYDV